MSNSEKPVNNGQRLNDFVVGSISTTPFNTDFKVKEYPVPNYKESVGVWSLSSVESMLYDELHAKNPAIMGRIGHEGLRRVLYTFDFINSFPYQALTVGGMQFSISDYKVPTWMKEELLPVRVTYFGDENEMDLLIRPFDFESDFIDGDSIMQPIEFNRLTAALASVTRETTSPITRDYNVKPLSAFKRSQFFIGDEYLPASVDWGVRPFQLKPWVFPIGALNEFAFLSDGLEQRAKLLIAGMNNRITLGYNEVSTVIRTKNVDTQSSTVLEKDVETE